MGFSSDVAERALASCGRCCSICHKFCGTKIELHHIQQVADGGDDTFDNCIPLCFDCHADVKAYNPKHPKGRQYTESELKRHRDLWYSSCALEKTNNKQEALPQQKRKEIKKGLPPKQKQMKSKPLSEIDEQFFENEYPNLVSDCRRIKKTVGAYEWKIIKAVLLLTDYGLSWEKPTLSDLLFELATSMDSIEYELSNLTRMGFLSLEDDEVSLQGKAHLIVDLANKVSEKLDPNTYPEELFEKIMPALIE